MQNPRRIPKPREKSEKANPRKGKPQPRPSLKGMKCLLCKVRIHGCQVDLPFHPACLIKLAAERRALANKMERERKKKRKVVT